uniref:HTH cro/C1-type domain-containing protein n=1 Tax=uncultured Alphaproteobacteria bacterium TaxID=91750 RepID=A0A1B0Z269_9PROT|nr:hypothetical protein [uncultured Alphaproteobacteria bacterium]
MPKRTSPITRQELDEMDARNPERLYKKKFEALREELGEELAHKALTEWVSHQRAESRKQGGIMTVLPPDAKMGRPKYVPILDRKMLRELRRSLRVSSDVLARRMGWKSYLWSRLENGAVNFTLERGMEIAAKLNVDFRTFMMSGTRGKAEQIIGTYEENLEEQLIDGAIQSILDDNESELRDIANDHHRDDDGEIIGSENEIRDYMDDIAAQWLAATDDDDEDNWQQKPAWKDLQAVKGRIADRNAELERLHKEFLEHKREFDAYFLEGRKQIEAGELDIESAEGGEFEFGYTSRARQFKLSWMVLDEALRDGTLPVEITARMIENSAPEYREWIDRAKDKQAEADRLDGSNDGVKVAGISFVEPPAEAIRQEVQGAAPAPPPASQLPQLPIYGSARAGSDSIDLDRGAAALSWTERPYFLAGVGNAYGCYVNSDSMYPVYSEGALLFVHPSKPVRKGDDCIVEVQKENEEPIGLVKRLLSKSSDKFIFEQFNPPARMEFAASEIKTLHLVVGSLTSGS